MKSFYRSQDRAIGSGVPAGLECTSYIECRARVAVYDGAAASPRVIDVGPLEAGAFIEKLATVVYESSSNAGGTIPYTVIREVAENLIHADFSEPVVSVLESGNTIRFADQGPGIADKERAVLPGFTTAHGAMKNYIRGVGSGLPIVSDFLAFRGGSLLIEDNLGEGAVVTISSSGPSATTVSVFPGDSGARQDRSGATRAEAAYRGAVGESDSLFSTGPILSTRQKQVLAVVLESGAAGPSMVSKELGVGLSTAYRDLALLEEGGLIVAVDGGKRSITLEGSRYLDSLTSAQ